MTRTSRKLFTKNILQLDVEQTVREIAQKMRVDIAQSLRKRGGVIGISGGIDSSVVLALAVHALGSDRMLGVLMPEHDSSASSIDLALELADKFGVQTVIEDISPTLEGLGCYRRRDEAVAQVFPEYDPQIHKIKIGLPQDILENDQLNIFSLTLVEPDGKEHCKRLPPQAYMQIVAASNFKQRSRMTMLYYHAESKNYAVVGTANKHEHSQGFFVKYGDGGADLFPIIHFYKTQIYQLARYLDIPEAIIERPPTADTYSAEITQEKFFFQLPFGMMDLLWYADENDYSADEVAPVLGLSKQQVERAFLNFERKRRTTAYLRMQPLVDY